MPDRSPDATDALDPAAADVLRRWNPSVLSGGRPLPSETERPTVLVLGPRGSGRGTLAALLGRGESAPYFTEDASRSADAMLMVLDSAGPLGREELALLERASGLAAGRVVFALARTDAHDGWASVLRRDAALLAAHAPRFAAAPIHPVSATRIGPGSGIPELRSALRAALDAADPATGEAARVRAGVEQAREWVRDAVSVLDRDEDTAALRAQRAVAVADRDGRRADAAATLRRLTALARVDLVHEVGSRVRAVSAASCSALDRGGRVQATMHSEYLRSEVARLTSAVDAVTADRLRRMAVEVLGPAAAGSGEAGGRSSADAGWVPAVESPEPRRRGVEDRLMVVVGASAGLGLGRLLAAPLARVPALELVGIPVMLLVGGLAAWWFTRARGEAADRAHLRSWSVDALAQVRSGLEQRVLGRLVDAEARIAAQVAVEHRDRVLETDERLAVLDRRLRESAQRSGARRAACERDLAVLDRVLGEDRAPDREEPSALSPRPSP
ncbi:hypothetical protein [Rhodococcus kronopolitis]|uniref:Uncharacterized protein n=1 Tax=Rhodococcus kronopolitis TaxID=1460226 RepID=A0ABV9FQG4_9NOCA